MSTRAGNTSAAPLADLSLKPDLPAGGSSSSVPDTFLRSPGPSVSGSGGPAVTARVRAHDTDPLDLPLFGPTPTSFGTGAGTGRDSYSRSTTRREMPAGAPDASPRDRAGSGAREAIDPPLINPSTPPRPPLAVRRPTGEPARARTRVTLPPSPIVEEPRLDLDLPERAPDTASSSSSAIADEPTIVDEPGVAAELPRVESDASAAPLGSRAIAALLDLAFLAAVDATVLHFTIRLTGLSLTLAGVERLPLAPFLGFLGLLNGGYLAMFTAASGQTMGKMAMGVKVVSMRGETVPFGNAVLRAILWLLTILPLGVGAIPALLTDDRRALHDRLADTRVVKVE